MLCKNEPKAVRRMLSVAENVLHLCCNLFLPGPKADTLGTGSEGIASQETADCLDEQLCIVQWVAGNNCFVQVRVKCHLLHIV